MYLACSEALVPVQAAPVLFVFLKASRKFEANYKKDTFPGLLSLGSAHQLLRRYAPLCVGELITSCAFVAWLPVPSDLTFLPLSTLTST